MSAQMKRLCPRCEVQWWATIPDTTDCPECGADGFWTMNRGDMGTAMYFEQDGRRPSSFREVSHPREQAPTGSAEP